MTRLRNRLAAFLTLNAGVLFAAGAHAGDWQMNAPFGATLQGDLYTPTTPAASPAVLVVIHMCTGHASTVHDWFRSAADQYGFYLIAPDAGKQCFESSATRAGDRAAIVKMVDYVVTNKKADKSRVFAAGMSSGGCMTNTLLAIYPDVFAGGSAMPGFPAGAWPSGDTTCTKCNSDPPSSDGKYWGDMARNAFSWSGSRPCSQQWVGGGDEYKFDDWLPAVAAQFQNLGNLGSGTPGTGSLSGWTRTVYKDSSGNVRLETNLGPTGQVHNLMTVGSPLYAQVVTFLGLDKPTGACGLTTSGTGGGSGSGGSSSGGSSATGGKANSGGTASMGGANAGGKANSGGVTSSSGGSNNGGATGSGGSSKGGASSGGNNTSAGGNANGSGGSANGSGGASGGGANGSGGSVSGSGGSVNGAGGGANGSGGAANASGGSANGSGGAAAGSSGSGGSDSSGCSCTTVGHASTHGSIAGLLAMSIGALFARRRRARN